MSAQKKRWRVLVSVTDKTGLVNLKPLLEVEGGAEFVSTGGTGKALVGLGFPVTEVCEVTGFPEMMDGRVKTLHPKISGGILGVLDNPEHVAAMKEHDIAAFNIVVVNLYDFLKNPNIEEIDIGGPTQIRAAAKNARFVVPIIDPADYQNVVSWIQKTGDVPMRIRQSLAIKVFGVTANYDSMIHRWMCQQSNAGQQFLIPPPDSKH